MEITTRHKNSFVVVQLPEIVNYEVNLALKTALEEICKKKGQSVAIDLTEVSFIGSLGIGLLAFAKKLVEDIDGRFCLISVNDMVRKIINRTGLQNVFTMIDSENSLN